MGDQLHVSLQYKHLSHCGVHLWKQLPWLVFDFVWPAVCVLFYTAEGPQAMFVSLSRSNTVDSKSSQNKPYMLCASNDN